MFALCNGGTDHFRGVELGMFDLDGAILLFLSKKFFFYNVVNPVPNGGVIRHGVFCKKGEDELLLNVLVIMND